MSPYNDDPRDKGLDIEMHRGVITISIGINALSQALTQGFEQRLDPIKVTNVNDFIDGVLRQLTWEEEDGSTVVHSMFDLAAERAIHDGCDGVEVGEEE